MSQPNIGSKMSQPNIGSTSRTSVTFIDRYQLECLPRLPLALAAARVQTLNECVFLNRLRFFCLSSSFQWCAVVQHIALGRGVQIFVDLADTALSASTTRRQAS